MDKELTILIVTYNSVKEIGECLDALTGFDPETIEIVVVDNASSDGTPKFLAEHYGNNPQYRLYFNEKNTGFAGGANQGVELAHSPVILSINPDTVASVSGVLALFDYFKAHPEVGILGPKITDEFGVPQETFGEDLTPWNELKGKMLYSKYAEKLPFIRGWKGSLLRAKKTKEVGWIGGACFMVRKDVYQRAGGIDQQFFLSHADLIDLSKRVKDLGYVNVLYAGAEIVHKGSKSVAHNRDEALRIAYIGTLYFFKKYYSAWSVFWVKVIYVTTSLFKALIAFPISLWKHEPYRAIAKAHYHNAMRILTGTLGTIY